jgi:uncharacterized protein (DUF169 family)
MQTYLERALNLRFPPLAIGYARELPPGAKLPSPMCSMLLVAQAAKGETVALSGDSCRCPGAASGFGLEPVLPDAMPGGSACFLRFLSVGNQDWDVGRAVLKRMKDGGAPKILLEEFAEGEGFLKTPELVDEWVKGLPETKPEGPYVVIKPLKDVKPGENPKVVALLANADQVSALAVLANFGGHGPDRVRMPFGAGCTCLGSYVFAEAEKRVPHAVVGLTDISARFYLRKPLGRDILSFAVPFAMFEEMEANAPESFLTRFAWKRMMEKP